MRLSRMVSLSPRRGGVVAAALMAVAGASSAQAAFLPVGGVLFPAPGEAGPAGAPFASMTQPYVATGFSGTLTSEVFIGDVTNPYGLDRYTFVYTLTSSQLSTNNVERLTIDGYDLRQTDGSFSTDAPGVVPFLITRSTADVVGFTFASIPPSSTIGPGMTTARLVVQTDSPVFAVNFASVIDGGVAQALAFAPNAIPTPGAAMLLGVGGLVATRRRRGN